MFPRRRGRRRPDPASTGGARCRCARPRRAECRRPPSQPPSRPSCCRRRRRHAIACRCRCRCATARARFRRRARSACLLRCTRRRCRRSMAANQGAPRASTCPSRRGPSRRARRRHADDQAFALRDAGFRKLRRDRRNGSAVVVLPVVLERRAAQARPAATDGDQRGERACELETPRADFFAPRPLRARPSRSACFTFLLQSFGHRSPTSDRYLPTSTVPSSRMRPTSFILSSSESRSPVEED